MEKSESDTDDPNHHSFEVKVEIKKERIRAQFERESKLVSAESLRMNKLLEAIEDGNDQL